MKPKHRGSRRQQQTIQVWTYAQAVHAVPYIRSIMVSLREHQLEVRNHTLAAQRLAKEPGRPNRSAIIALEHIQTQARLAEDRFQDALEELGVLDVFCLDPLGGLALVPFDQNDKLAWFIFDLHDETPFRFWRYHTDPLETRRPLAEALKDKPDARSIETV